MNKVKLVDICRPKQWKTISGNEILSDGKYPVYGANGKIGFYNTYTHEHSTLLITCRGATCGTLNICDPKSYVNGNAMALDNLSDKVNLKFLFYSLTSRGLHDTISGSAQPQITREGLSQVTLNIPPLTTQKAIAEKLDKADALRKKNQQLLKLYDELAQSVFIEMFGNPVMNEKGWEVLNGDEYSNNISVGVVIKPASHYVEKGIVALRSLNIKANHFDLRDVVYFSENSHFNIVKKSILKKDDIVVVRTGNTGTAAVITDELDGVNCIDLIIIRPNPSLINSIYLSCLLNSESGKNLTTGYQVGGIQKHFNVGSIKKINLPIPPLCMQQKFAKLIGNIDAQKALIKEQVAESENLFQSLLQESFN